MTRSLYHVLNSRSSWNSNVQLTDEAIREIMFWKLNARSPNGLAAWPTQSKPSKIVYSDASDCIAVLLANFYESSTSKKRPRTLPGVFQVERLVAMKQQRKVVF